MERKRALDEAQEASDELGRRIAGNGGRIRSAQLARLREDVESRALELAAAVEEVRSLGVLVKDLDTGLVDFPSVREGEQVLLCWRLGEDEVAFFHGYDDGFAGRCPL